MNTGRLNRLEPFCILIVEDNDDHAELVQRCFEDHGMRLHMSRVSDGESAVHYMQGVNEYKDRTLYPSPHLVLLDLRLPRLDGLEVLKIIKGDPDTRHVPVVMLTSSTNEKDLMTAYNHFVNSYLVKPLEYEDFLKLVDDIAAYWFDVNEKPPHA